ncbi:SpoVR family protein [Arenibaculum pallidiluteum]|uniref:SpoVR family protein n=1 Tax=Arenibaculum pallidiluteum TaxID=2812559 RepID=UPI001A969F56|nr:SpoVR family protein [Arenibaculum pallidiluteum]
MLNQLSEPGLLYEGADWDYDKIKRVYDAIETVARGEMGLDIYPNQIEVITSEQMLDAYSSIGMPLMYKHWSFGKHFARDEMLYRKGLRGLAYEIVINSSPCISYVMEENSMTMQTLVIAHAAFGHNHFFKNNNLFRQWTDAKGILDYLEFAKNYISRCEDRYGQSAVERVLDAAHALMSHGVHRYPRKTAPDLREEEQRERERQAYQEKMYNDLWRTVPTKPGRPEASTAVAERKALLGLPEENILYFLEKKAPRLKPWQRELLRIVRHISQYFYPQKQTKLMNEGCATYTHYYIMNRLHQKGQINEGAMLEFLHSHTAVVFQPEFDDPRYSGINPYALGFAMMQDIARIASDPTLEDREWFPDWAGNGDPMGTLRDAWANFRDESFVLQFLSPALMRKLRLFQVRNDATEPELVVENIHNERGYRSLRKALARSYDIARLEPDIQIVDVDLAGDRKLLLQHRVTNRILLDESDARAVLRHIANLWGYEVALIEVDATSEAVLKEHTVAGSSVLLG